MRDFCVVSAYFNPERYVSKLSNYRRFRAGLAAAGIPLLTVEAVFDGVGDLRDDPAAVQVPCRDVMWQKERLLNIALERLPAHAVKVAWLDADLVFEDPSWSREAQTLLDKHAVVQPFEFVVRLPRGAERDDGRGEAWRSFAAVYRRFPNLLLKGNFEGHGHTGFAWAARRDALPLGLYDGCVAGSGDHAMAHAFCGDWESPCIARLFGGNDRHYRHFRKWAQRTYEAVRADVAYVPGTVCHLWHGDLQNRSYLDRLKCLSDFSFDPSKHLIVSRDGCWEWNGISPQTRSGIREYFAQRREDGD